MQSKWKWKGLGEEKKDISNHCQEGSKLQMRPCQQVVWKCKWSEYSGLYADTLEDNRAQTAGTYWTAVDVRFQTPAAMWQKEYFHVDILVIYIYKTHFEWSKQHYFLHLMNWTQATVKWKQQGSHFFKRSLWHNSQSKGVTDKQLFYFEKYEERWNYYSGRRFIQNNGSELIVPFCRRCSTAKLN